MSTRTGRGATSKTSTRCGPVPSPTPPRVLKNLRLVSQKKSLSFREKKMYEKARYFIVSEVLHVREISEEDAEVLVEKALTGSLEKISKAKAS